MTSPPAAIDARLSDFIAQLPSPGSSPSARLEHTLAALAEQSDSHPMLRSRTAVVTLGDLRDLQRGPSNETLYRVMTTLVDLDAQRESAQVLIRATHGVYGPDVITGLTWADLRDLTL